MKNSFKNKRKKIRKFIDVSCEKTQETQLNFPLH